MAGRPFLFTALSAGVLFSAVVCSLLSDPAPRPPGWVATCAAGGVPTRFADSGELAERIACWSVQGRLQLVDAVLVELDASARQVTLLEAFDLVHPIADAGDDALVAPVMERLLEVRPDHFQARYHAGMGAYARGDREAARRHLVQFLVDYPHDDGWTRNALEVLSRP